MKGLLLGIPIMGLIFLGTVTVLILLPVFALKIHIIKQVDIQYKYNNAQLTMLTLLSSTNDKKEISQTIGEYIKLQSKPKIDFLKNILDQQIESKCYVLYSIDTQENIVQSCDNSAKKDGGYLYTADNIKIPLPYKPLSAAPSCTNIDPSAKSGGCGDMKLKETRGGGAARETQYWICSDECFGSNYQIGCTKEIENLKLEDLTCCPLQNTGEWREGKYGEWLKECPKTTTNKNLVARLRLVMN